MWYVLSVRPNAERKVEAALLSKGIDAITPTQKQWRQWSDRRKCVEVVLFTRYVFVSPQPNQVLEALNLEHVFSYLHFDGKKARLTDAEIALIQKLGKQEHKVDICYAQFYAGQKIEVIAGPLKGYCGTVSEVKGKRKLILQIAGLNCCAYVELHNMESRLFERPHPSQPAQLSPERVAVRPVPKRQKQNT